MPNKAKQGQESGAGKYNRRRWQIPSKRAKGYAADRKAKVHTYGPKEGKELTDYEAGIRSGFFSVRATMPRSTSTRRRLRKGRARKKPARSRRRGAENNGGKKNGRNHNQQRTALCTEGTF